jgi:hypothetical protein
MTLSRLSRILVGLVVLVAAMQILGLLLFAKGGSQPPTRGQGDPIGYPRQP